MDDQARKAMLKEEDEAVFIQLIAGIGWVFHHPILREWVKVAPSVNSIDKFISDLFYGYEHKIELVKSMRKAVKAWNMEKDKKNLLETSKEWRLADMFVIQTLSEFPSRAGGKEFLKFASDIKFLPDAEKAISCNDWPMLLKEFGHEWGDGFKTSVDCLKGDANQFWRVEKIGAKFWQDGNAEAFKGRPQDLTDFGYCLNLKRKRFDSDRSIAWADILLKQFGIMSQIVQVDPGPGEIYPRFYKTVVFCDQRYGDVIHSIRVLWPIDCCRDDKGGQVIFSKSIEVGGQMRAVLELKYKFGKSFELIASPKNLSYDPHSHIQLQISSVQQSSLFQTAYPVPETKKVAEVMSILFEDFVKAWKFSIKQPSISLESILGESMIKVPPDSLLQIFTGP